jgi:hypothetical protein
MSTRSITALAGAFFFMVVPTMAQGQYAQQGQSAPLPAGAGKELVEGVCTGAIRPTRLRAVPGTPVKAGGS